MNKIGKYHYWSFWDTFIYLVIFVISSLIVTFLVSPNSFNNFKSNIEELIPPKIISENSSSFQIGNNRIECQDDFNKDMNQAEVKDSQTKFKLIEVKSTPNLKEATDYINEWNPYNKREILSYLSNNFKQNPEGLQENINLILYRVDYYDIWYNAPMSQIDFAVCNGERALFPNLHSRVFN